MEEFTLFLPNLKPLACLLHPGDCLLHIMHRQTDRRALMNAEFDVSPECTHCIESLKFPSMCCERCAKVNISTIL